MFTDRTTFDILRHVKIQLGLLRQLIKESIAATSQGFERTLAQFVESSGIAREDVLQGLAQIVRHINSEKHGLSWQGGRLTIVDQNKFDGASFDKDYRTDAVVRQFCDYLIQSGQTLSDTLHTFATKPEKTKPSGAIPLIDIEFPKAGGGPWNKLLGRNLDKYDLPKLPAKGAYIASGMQGEVYDYGGDKVIKIATTTSTNQNPENDSNIRGVIKVVRTQRNNDHGCIARIFGFDVVAKFKTAAGVQYVYYIISEKLQPIKGYLEDHPGYSAFAKCIEKSGLKIRDLDSYNVMQTADGQLKVVDYGFVE